MYLGACRWEHRFPMVSGCTRLEHAGRATCSHAIAYRDSAYERLLAEVPSDSHAMQEWLTIHCGIDQYYACCWNDKKYILAPSIATQKAILALENEELRQRIAGSCA